MKYFTKSNLVKFSILLVVLVGVVGLVLTHTHEEPALQANTPLQKSSDNAQTTSSTLAVVGDPGAPLSDSGPQPCLGNESDMCVLAPSIDFWPSGSENSANPDYSPAPNSVRKQIGGKVTASEGNAMSLTTTTGRVIKVMFPLDSIAWWNQNRATYYNNYQIGVGDTITVTYGEPTSSHVTTINPSQIFTTVLAIKTQSSKAATFERY